VLLDDALGGNLSGLAFDFFLAADPTKKGFCLFWGALADFVCGT
jgi:hypothetical protein